MDTFLMCKQSSCVKYSDCYRAQKEPEQMQDYLQISMLNNTGQLICPFFINISKHKPIWQDDDIVAQQQGEGYGHFAPFQYGCNCACWEED